MATSGHGGARSGAGRPAGASNAGGALRDAARVHTQAALDVLVDALTDENASIRMRAAETLLERGWGKAMPETPAMGIIGRYMDGAISAMQAALELEANGLTVGQVLGLHLGREISRFESDSDPVTHGFMQLPALPRQ